MRDEFPAGKLFGAARPYADDLIEQMQRREQRRSEEAEQLQVEQADEARTDQAKRERHAEEAKLRAVWATLPIDEQQRLYDEAIASAGSEFQRVRLARRRDLKHPPREVLAQIGSQHAA